MGASGLLPRVEAGGKIRERSSFRATLHGSFRAASAALSRAAGVPPAGAGEELSERAVLLLLLLGVEHSLGASDVGFGPRSRRGKAPRQSEGTMHPVACPVVGFGPMSRSGKEVKQSEGTGVFPNCSCRRTIAAGAAALRTFA